CLQMKERERDWKRYIHVRSRPRKMSRLISDMQHNAPAPVPAFAKLLGFVRLVQGKACANRGFEVALVCQAGECIQKFAVHLGCKPGHAYISLFGLLFRGMACNGNKRAPTLQDWPGAF